jgi:biopolymer transport protein ExbD
MSFGRLQRRPAARPMSEINMTPLIDVMLVLLVVFIISAPLLARSLQLQLPAAEATAPGPAPAVLALAIDAQGQFFLGDAEGRLPALPLPAAQARERITAQATAAARRDPATEVQLRADERVPYGRVAELIGWLQAAGLTRIGLVTQPPAVPAGPPAPPAPAAPAPARPAAGG